MAADITRPESPELDQQQISDLRSFFKKKSLGDLKNALNQTIQDASKDNGPYKSGGSPANSNKTVAILQQLIEERS